MNVDKTIFVLSGKPNTGKTTTIVQTHELLDDLPGADELPGFSKANQNPDDQDIERIIDVGCVRIGIVSQGDDSDKAIATIQEFQNKNCHIIICACYTRDTKGSIMKYINSLPDSYSCCWFRTPEISGEWLFNDNEKEEACKAYSQVTANMIFNMIKNHIKAA